MFHCQEGDGDGYSLFWKWPFNWKMTKVDKLRREREITKQMKTYLVRTTTNLLLCIYSVWISGTITFAVATVRVWCHYEPTVFVINPVESYNLFLVDVKRKQQSLKRKHSGNAVGLYSGRYLVRVSIRTLAILTEVFRGLRKSLQASIRTVTRISHDRFLPYPFEFIIYQSSHYPTLCLLRYKQRCIIDHNEEETGVTI
jgi:hypothetical protein